MVNRRAPSRVAAHRFFISPEDRRDDLITFSPGQSHQIRTVLRLQPGDRVIAVDQGGQEHVVEMRVVRNAAVGTIMESAPNRAEPATLVALYVGLLKSAKLELVLQKGTELGVSSYVPVVTARSIAFEPGATKWHRFETIVREAAEQSRRGRVPSIRPPLAYAEALRAAAAGGPIIVLWEGEESKRLREVPLHGADRVSLFIGPEGGFTPDEIESARALGAVVVSLGPRILRAETAAIVAATLLLDHVGEL